MENGSEERSVQSALTLDNLVELVSNDGLDEIRRHGFCGTREERGRKCVRW